MWIYFYNKKYNYEYIVDFCDFEVYKKNMFCIFKLIKWMKLIKQFKSNDDCYYYCLEFEIPISWLKNYINIKSKDFLKKKKTIKV